MMLEAPLPGSEKRVTPMQAEEEGAAFMQLMAMEQSRKEESGGA
jgi:hypothetical protein